MPEKLCYESVGKVPRIFSLISSNRKLRFMRDHQSVCAPPPITFEPIGRFL
jgi:hypothetical protein